MGASLRRLGNRKDIGRQDRLGHGVQNFVSNICIGRVIHENRMQGAQLRTTKNGSARIQSVLRGLSKGSPFLVSLSVGKALR
jgi:hypothetical protein